MDLIKITPDKEKAKSIIKMTDLIMQRIKIQDKKSMTALIISDYYEIIKELLTAVLLIEGYKTLSHKDLIDYIKEHHKDFSKFEISILDDLRMLRNRIAYEGFFVDYYYLEKNEDSFVLLITKLKNLLEKRIN